MNQLSYLLATDKLKNNNNNKKKQKNKKKNSNTYVYIMFYFVQNIKLLLSEDKLTVTSLIVNVIRLSSFLWIGKHHLYSSPRWYTS